MKKSRIDYIFDGLAVVFTASQTQEVLQIISIILTCLATLSSLAFTLYLWWKKAKSDGQITKDEIIEAGKIVDDHLKQIDDITKKKKEE